MKKNKTGLTFIEWLNASGNHELYQAWRNNEDPSEYRADTQAKNTNHSGYIRG